MHSQCVTAYPYTESFETGTGNWFTGGTNNDWAWTTPSKPTITGAGAGSKCWVTGGPVATFYNLGERSWVQSPCFDFTTLNNPYISFLVFWETERSYDGGNVQYSTDGGTTWITIGSVNETDTCSTHNWYNISHVTNLSQITSGTQGWSGTVQQNSGSCAGGGGSGGWKRATHCIENLAHKPSVKFRFTFGSGTTCNDFDGFAFDDIFIGEAPSHQSDFTFSCLTNEKFQFIDPYSACRSGRTWDFNDPGSTNNISNVSAPSHTFSHPGLFSVSLTVTGGCTSDTTIIKQVSVKDATAQVTYITCVGADNGAAVINTLYSIGPLTYQWSHDPNLNSPSATGLPAGNYQVQITDSLCPIGLSFGVWYSLVADVHVSLGNDTILCPGTSFVLMPEKFSSYQWQDNSTDSFYVVKTEGLYSVVVKNSSGCSGSDTVFVREDCLNDILFPKAFTPNGDGINEKFYAGGSNTEDFEIFIYDRWGSMIFSSPDRETGWDGTAKGHAVQEGFYNFVVNYSIGNEQRVKTGSVLVIR
jgi:gliding motility-associated-like protein